MGAIGVVNRVNGILVNHCDPASVQIQPHSLLFLLQMGFIVGLKPSSQHPILTDILSERTLIFPHVYVLVTPVTLELTK